MEAPSKKGFWENIFGNNREFDSTMTVFFVFFITAATMGAVIGALLMGRTVPQEMFDVINVFENFILMILSYFFTRATTGNGNGPMNRDQGSQK